MKFILLIFLVTLSVNDAQNRWEKLNGPPGGTVYSLFINGDTLLAGVGDSRGTIFYSFNKGASWIQSELRLGKLGYGSRILDFIFTDDGGILASAAQMGIYKSYDFIRWENVLPNALSYRLGKDINGYLYLGNDGNILVSFDNGYNWSISFDGGIGFIQKFVSVDDSYLYWGSRSKVLRKSYNSGWESIIVSPIQQDFAPFIDDQGNIYAHSENYLYRSTNGGIDWTELDTNRFLRTCYIDDMIFNNRIIAGGGAIAGFHPNWGIVVSDDTGYTWKVSNNGLPLNLRMLMFYKNPEMKLLLERVQPAYSTVLTTEITGCPATTD